MIRISVKFSVFLMLVLFCFRIKKDRDFISTKKSELSKGAIHEKYNNFVFHFKLKTVKF
jgi:hypothetical protein